MRRIVICLTLEKVISIILVQWDKEILKNNIVLTYTDDIMMTGSKCAKVIT